MKKLTIIAIIALFGLRILSATTLPDLHGDEFRRAETIQSFLDGQPKPFPTFSLGPVPILIKTDAGFSSLPFLAPATIWAAIFGTSPTSLRIFISIIVSLSLILLAYTISLWYDKKSRQKVFLLSAIIALTLPWLFLQGIIFWDTSLAPVCFILAFYAFTKLKFAPAKKPNLRYQLLLPLSLITATYLYMPSAIPAVTLYFAAVIYLKHQKIWQTKHLITSLTISALASLPFLIFLLTFNDATFRTEHISVFYQTDFLSGLTQIIRNFALLVNPAFLFITGDGSFRHSIGMFGMLGPLAIIPIVSSIYYATKKLLTQNEKLLLIIASTAIIAANFSSALTDSNSQPHSLRANASAPFYILIICLGTAKLLARHKKATIPVYILLALSFLAYVLAFLIIYLPTGRLWFTHPLTI